MSTRPKKNRRKAKRTMPPGWRIGTPVFDFRETDKRFIDTVDKEAALRAFDIRTRDKFHYAIARTMFHGVPLEDIHYARIPMNTEQIEANYPDDLRHRTERHYQLRPSDTVELFITVSYALDDNVVLVAAESFAALSQEQHRVFLEEHLEPLVATCKRDLSQFGIGIYAIGNDPDAPPFAQELDLEWGCR